MKTKQLKLLKLVTPLALAALLIPAISSGFPTDTDTYLVTAERMNNFSIDFADPDGPANDPSHPDWASATATNVPLAYIIFASANAKGGFDDWAEVNPDSVRHLSVKSIHDGKEILFRVEWEDETFDENARDVPRFFDAVAMMLPYKSGYPKCIPGPTSEPMIHMGMRCDGLDEGGEACTKNNSNACKCCPVNIHFWRPDKVEVENIVTNGAGTTMETQETDDPTLFHAWQEWSDNGGTAPGRWTVIMGRAMSGPANPDPAHPDATRVGPGGHMVPLEMGQSYATVWANWDGSRDERNGSKFIGLFGTLFIDPSIGPM